MLQLSKTAENTDEAGDGQSSISQRLGKYVPMRHRGG